MRASDLIKQLCDVIKISGDIPIKHREPGYAWENAIVSLMVHSEDVIPKPTSDKFLSISLEQDTV